MNNIVDRIYFQQLWVLKRENLVLYLLLRKPVKVIRKNVSLSGLIAKKVYVLFFYPASITVP